MTRVELSNIIKKQILVFLKKYISYLSRVPLEAYLWFAGLLFLFFINPYEEAHFTLCPLNNLGFDFCPGCGVGRSISFFFHGDIFNSLKSHPIGILAFIILSSRIISLVYKSFRIKNIMEVPNG